MAALGNGGSCLFGYIRACTPQLRVCELEAYKAVYCGLCHELGRRFGPLARLTLSYDFTFLAMLELALREDSPQLGRRRCAVNPLKKVPALQDGDGLSYACDAAVLMLWHKLRDDAADSGSWKRLGARLGLLLAGRGYRQAAGRLPELSRVMAEAMERQARLEREGCGNPDEACQPTADILSAVFRELSRDPAEIRVLERLGQMLGRYVYLADALDDLERDKASGNYNPFLAAGGGEDLRDSALGSLYLTIAEAGKAYELLNIQHFGPILDNILFLGLREVADELHLPPEHRKRHGGSYAFRHA